MEDFKTSGTFSDFCKQHDLDYERARAFCRYHGIVFKKITVPGMAPQNALSIEEEDRVLGGLKRIDARKGKETGKKATVISFINQKGGVGKTTSAINVGAALSLEGFSVLVVDCDPQATLTITMFEREQNPCILDVLKGNTEAKKAIMKCEKFDIIPANISMSDADIVLNQELSREYLLKEAVKDLGYDFILVDAPPALSILSINALVASDYVVFPVKAEGMSIMGLNQLFSIFKKVKKSINKDIEILGVLITDDNGNTNVSKESKDALSGLFGNQLFSSVIRHNSHLAEAAGSKQDIFSFKSDSNGAHDYKTLTIEMLKKIFKADEELKEGVV
jgi:chromosome partitioning protein